MNISTEQQQAIERGQPVETILNGVRCVVLRKETFEELAADTVPAIVEEMNLLADETADMLSGDGLDEPLES